MFQYLSSEIKDIKESMEILEDALIAVDDIGKGKTLNDYRNVIIYRKKLWRCQQYPKSIKDILQDFWKNAVKKGEILSWTKELTKRFVFTKDVKGEKRVAFGAFPIKHYYIIPSLQDCMALDISQQNLYHYSFSYIPIHFSSVCDCMYTFMELSENSKYIGTIVFKLSTGRRSQHFRMLCTGEEGPSYKGTKFFCSGGNYNCFLAGGDYENNDGSGGKGLYSFVDDCVQGMRKGLVCGHHSDTLTHLGQFKIFYKCRGNDPSFARGTMAEVVRGLQLVRDIAKSGRFTNVIISECGIMFFTSYE